MSLGRRRSDRRLADRGRRAQLRTRLSSRSAGQMAESGSVAPEHGLRLQRSAVKTEGKQEVICREWFSGDQSFRGSIPVTGTLYESPFNETRGIRREQTTLRGTRWSTVWSTVTATAPESAADALCGSRVLTHTEQLEVPLRFSPLVGQDLSVSK